MPAGIAHGHVEARISMATPKQLVKAAERATAPRRRRRKRAARHLRTRMLRIHYLRQWLD